MQALADFENQKRIAEAAKRAKAAQRAAANKSFKYKGGLTIEEHSDEEETNGALSFGL